MAKNTKTPLRHFDVFGESSNAVVIGLPPNFDVCSRLKRATDIRLTTAFAHWSGWNLLEGAVRNSRAELTLVTRFDFCQTEPQVPRDWLALAQVRPASLRVYIAKGVTFHPKVLMVSGPTGTFAVVGSANLSKGGLKDNVECSIFVSEKAQLDQLRSRFDLVANDVVTIEPTIREIDEYEPKFNAARAALASIRAGQNKL